MDLSCLSVFLFSYGWVMVSLGENITALDLGIQGFFNFEDVVIWICGGL